jgi:nucleotide-binding universal stress UspA family protein
MKKILVPTDFSRDAENALKVAANLANKFDNCELHLVHLIEIHPHQVDAMNPDSELPEAIFFIKLAEKRFKEVLELDFLKGIDVRDHVRPGEDLSNVKDIAKEFECEIIIMGSHGTSGLEEMFVGSNAEKVVRTAEVPVLVIKNEHETFNIKNFVYASDFSTESKSAFHKAINFAELFGANIELLYVNTPNKFVSTKDATNKIKTFINNTDYKNITFSIYNEESVELGILNFSKDVNADLIGVSTHGRQGLAHFLNGSISEDVVNHAKRPVLAFRIDE